MNLHFLHGFLGLPSDWDEFQKSFSPHTCRAHPIEEFLTPMCPEKDMFKTWAQNFNQSIFNLNTQKNDNKNKREMNVLIGYSLGGRLALHSLLEKNDWTAAIIISANPGLSNEHEKRMRVKADEQWADRFRTESWDSVLSAWNAQGVFSGQKNNLTRNENLYDRNVIADILTRFSLGKQNDLRTEIKKLSIPILWISGLRDDKFSVLGKEMAELNKNIKSVFIENAGHRVPWENQEKFINICTQFFTHHKNYSPLSPI